MDCTAVRAPTKSGYLPESRAVLCAKAGGSFPGACVVFSGGEGCTSASAMTGVMRRADARSGFGERSFYLREKAFPFGPAGAGWWAVSDLLTALRDHPTRQFAEGETVLEQGQRTGLLYILVEGAVEVIKDDTKVAAASEPGAIFGDLSVLLEVPHTATVRATKSSKFCVITNPRSFLDRHPAACLHLCELLARRLDAVNKYLVDVKQQYVGHDHIGMVDGALDTLMNRQPRRRVVPRPSTLRGPEVAN